MDNVPYPVPNDSHSGMPPGITSTTVPSPPCRREDGPNRHTVFLLAFLNKAPRFCHSLNANLSVHVGVANCGIAAPLTRVIWKTVIHTLKKFRTTRIG